MGTVKQGHPSAPIEIQTKQVGNGQLFNDLSQLFAQSPGGTSAAVVTAQTPSSSSSQTETETETETSSSTAALVTTPTALSQGQSTPLQLVPALTQIGEGVRQQSHIQTQRDSQGGAMTPTTAAIPSLSSAVYPLALLQDVTWGVMRLPELSPSDSSPVHHPTDLPSSRLIPEHSPLAIQQTLNGYLQNTPTDSQVLFARHGSDATQSDWVNGMPTAQSGYYQSYLPSAAQIQPGQTILQGFGDQTIVHSLTLAPSVPGVAQGISGGVMHFRTLSLPSPFGGYGGIQDISAWASAPDWTSTI